jgi:hypothetical protein
MKLLYISSWHGTLEYDELTLFTELGIDWFSTGLYLDPQNPISVNMSREPINKPVNPELKDEFLRANPDHKIYTIPVITKEFAQKFDIVLVEHCTPTGVAPLLQNWEAIKDKPVVWRTYTQQSPQVELQTQPFRAQGLKLVRISPKERTIGAYAGDDAIIRTFVDDKEYNGWTGEDPVVLTFNNMFAKRALHSNTPIYMKIAQRMKPVKFELYGCDNQDAPQALGELSWEQVKEKYRKARVYFALGSKPASLTYNLMEAMMTGCPIVTWGPNLGNMKIVPGWEKTYEACDVIKNGLNGFWSDSEFEIEAYIKMLLKDDALAKRISANARKTAIQMFSKDKIRNDWKVFLNGLL